MVHNEAVGGNGTSVIIAQLRASHARRRLFFTIPVIALNLPGELLFLICG
jgi:hypothetical protein